MIKLFFLLLLVVSCRPILVKNSHEKILALHGSSADGSQYFSLKNKKIHYRVKGKGPAILLIPGTVDTLHTYDSLSKHLVDHFTLITVDIPGFGFSEAVEANNADQFIREVNLSFHQLLKSRGINKYHILGNSLGGLLAWTHSLEFPENVQKTILLSPAAFEQEVPWFFDVSNPIVQNLGGLFSGILPMDLVVKMIAKNEPGLIGETSNHYFIQKHLKRLVDIFQTRKNIPSYLATLELFSTYNWSDNRYLHLLEPEDTLLFFGERDTIVPVREQLPKWRQAIPNLKVEVISNGAHLYHWEKPKELSVKIKRFLKN